MLADRAASGIEALNQLNAGEIEAALSASPASAAALARSAAEAGSATAQAVYAQMLLDGYGVTCDPVAAFRWFVTAARQENLDAINMVGRCYDLGWGTPVNKERAAEWFRAAALRGLDWGMYNYATALALGAGLAEDKVEALVWFERAAALGNAKAMNFVGSFHEDGWTVPRDLARAADCYRQAASGGDFRGCFNHARMLIEAGRVDDALYWLGRAADGGNDRFRRQVRDYLSHVSDPRLADAARLFAAESERC
jgi:uncharacterized protein